MRANLAIREKERERNTRDREQHNAQQENECVKGRGSRVRG